MQENQQTDPQQDVPEKLSKTKIAILTVFSLVMLFLLAFSCYGCSYQPINPPQEEEAIDVVARLANTSWQLDETEGTPTLSELYDLVLSSISFSGRDAGLQQLDMDLTLRDEPSASGTLLFVPDEGFGFLFEGDLLPIQVVYDVSRDGNTETLTLVGEESNGRMYYLKI